MFFLPVYWVIAVLSLAGGAGMVAYGIRSLLLPGSVSGNVHPRAARYIGSFGLLVMAMGFWFVRRAREPDDEGGAES